MAEEIARGTLYVVSTPIGNLDDISRRAEKVLAGVDLIAAEDTRTTGILLRHLNIQTPLISCFSHNEQRRSASLVERMRMGRSVAVVTDAGTPGISDPAAVVVREAIAAGIPVVAVPGASALLAALVSSGLPMDRFVFEGFLPLKKGRQTKWRSLAEEERTIVVYESPRRIIKALEEIREHLGNRYVVVARELTKKFEEIRRGRVDQILAVLQLQEPRGEYVLLIAGTSYKTEEEDHGETEQPLS